MPGFYEPGVRSARPPSWAPGVRDTPRKMSFLERLLGHRRHPRPEPSPQDVAAIDIPGMIATARERGDTRDDPEVVAALLLGAETTADRHPDEDMRRRAAAAGFATRDWLVARVGEDEAARLLSASEGPVDPQGRTARGRA